MMYRSTSETTSSLGSAVWASMKSIACWRVHPSAWSPESTTSRPARSAWLESIPRRRPTNGGEPGSDAEPHGAEPLAGQHPEAIEIARVELHLVGEPLGVERPTFLISRVAQVTPDGMDLLPLERDRALQVMAGNRFVKRGRLRERAALGFGLVRVDEEHGRPASVLGRRGDG